MSNSTIWNKDGSTLPKAYSYIRFSTKSQLKGDSLRRQTERSEAWAKQNGLELDKSLRDIGVSAFKGKNATEGAFGEFLAAVDAGQIAKGSTLIVESLDRISRENVMTAFTQFSEILKRGIRIVTLIDGQVYSTEDMTAHPFQIFGSIMVMQRAHEESQTKSYRLRESWKNRRKRAEENATPITPICPAWLKIKEDKTGFVVREDRQKIIREIFGLRKAGKGKIQIQRILNERKVAPWNLSKRLDDRNRPVFWHYGYIERILHNRQLLGEFQPYKIVGDKRQPSGEPIANYFPAVIPTELFHAVNGARKLVAGRPSSREKNLFSGIAFCRCGASMLHTDKGAYKYLVCSAAKGKAGCRYVTWNYSAFETSFLTWVQKPEVMHSLTAVNSLNLVALESACDTAKGKMLEVKSKLDALLKIAESGKAPQTVLARMVELETEKTNAEKLCEESALRLEREREVVRTAQHDSQKIQKLAVKISDVSVRASLKHELRKRVERIVVYPDKAPVNSAMRAQLVEEITMWNDAGEGQVSSSDGQQSEVPKTPPSIVNNPLYQVLFQNGRQVTVIPDPDAPEEILYASTVSCGAESEPLWAEVPPLEAKSA